MSIKEMEALLEATRQKIAGQARLNACCVDADLLDKERELEQAIHYLEKGSFILDSIDDYATREQANLGDIAMPSVAAAVLKLLTPPHGRFFRNGVEHTLTQEDYNEETCAFVEEQDEPMSSNKWRGILQELAQRCPPDRWADDAQEGQEGPSPDTFECGYCCALMQLHAMSMREGHCIPIDEFPIPYIVEQANLADLIAPHEGDKE